MHWPDFWPHPDDEDAKDLEIKRVTLQFAQGAFTDSYGANRPRGDGVRRSPEKPIIIELPEDLREKVKHAFDLGTRPLCYAKSIHIHGAIGSNQLLGKLEIEQGNGQVTVIGMQTYGFTLGDGYGDFDNTFFSGFLAELIDDACFANSGQHLPEEFKEKLSGLTEVMDSKRAYRRLTADLYN